MSNSLWNKMDLTGLKALLRSVAAGQLPIEAAAERIAALPYEDIGYAHVDHHRAIRKGIPEVIFGQGKSAEQIAGIMEKMIPQGHVVLVSRLAPSKAERLCARFPEAVYHPDARMLALGKRPPARKNALILILSAGTSDIPVAAEAAVTAEYLGNEVKTVYDVGVAGIHRLFAHKPLIDRARVLVVVAGMEGALPSVVAGLVAKPVIAVPTSIGYGTSLGGLTALFGMLNSCSANVAVVNIDNGFGAGYLAAVINRL